MKTTQQQPELQQLRQLQLFHNVVDCKLSRLLKGFRLCEYDEGEVLLSPFKRNQYL
jgi:hypothetical protein